MPSAAAVAAIEDWHFLIPAGAPEGMFSAGSRKHVPVGGEITWRVESGDLASGAATVMSHMAGVLSGIVTLTQVDYSDTTAQITIRHGTEIDVPGVGDGTADVTTGAITWNTPNEDGITYLRGEVVFHPDFNGLNLMYHEIKWHIFFVIEAHTASGLGASSPSTPPPFEAVTGHDEAIRWIYSVPAGSFPLADPAYDAFSDSGNEANPNWTHTPAGTPRAVIVSVWTSPGVTPSAVTYGGVSCSASPSSPSLAIGECGEVNEYFLGASVPTGAQTVAVTTAGSVARATAITLTGDTDMEVVDDASVRSTSQANPSATLSVGGRASFGMVSFISGALVGAVAPLSGWTQRLEVDNGTQSGGIYTFNTVGTSDITAGYTAAADDVNMVGVAVANVVASGSVAAGAGAATAAATGASTSQATASSAGVGAATATGSSTAAATGTSTGTSTTASTGASTAQSTAASAGVAAATSVGASTAQATAAAAGVAAATATASSTATAVASTAGVSTAAATSDSGAESEATASAAGTSTVAAFGISTATATASAAGTGIALAASEGSVTAVGAADGTSTVAGVGMAIFSGVASTSSTSTALAIGVAELSGIGVSVGASVALAVATSTATATAAASGVAVALGVSPTLWNVISRPSQTRAAFSTRIR